MRLEFTAVSETGAADLVFDVRELVVAGWTGRDRAAVEEHIAELEGIGVKRPRNVPMHYRLANWLATMAPVVQVSGDTSSGEAEAMLLNHEGRLYVGLGSDHTDRELETQGVTASKQVCPKPVARKLWPFEEIADHWDALQLRSWIVEDGRTVTYQEGTLAALLPPEEVIARGFDGGTLPDGALMMCGTVPVQGGIRPSGHFACELLDPVRGRRIDLSYDIHVRPIVD